jgi:hypothetical protein
MVLVTDSAAGRWSTVDLVGGSGDILHALSDWIAEHEDGLTLEVDSGSGGGKSLS